MSTQPSSDPPRLDRTWLDGFYPIVDSIAWLETVIAGGARLVQLRIKQSSSQQSSNQQGSSQQPSRESLRTIIGMARALCATARVQLIVNDHWQLAVATGCDFVHLGQGDLDSADVPALRRHGIKLGISTHDHAELQRALDLQPDYVALGPIYPTQLKQMPWAPQGLERIGEWKRLIGSTPLVAIGGLTVERVADVLAAGADSAAVITDIVTSVTPEQRIRAWLAATRRP